MVPKSYQSRTTHFFYNFYHGQSIQLKLVEHGQPAQEQLLRSKQVQWTTYTLLGPNNEPLNNELRYLHENFEKRRGSLFGPSSVYRVENLKSIL